MVQLDSCVYFYNPTVRVESEDGTSPALVVLCTWADARPLHVTKYIKGYQALYPLASILMIRSESLDFAYRGRKALEQRSRSAVAVVQSTCSSQPQGQPPRILLHICSNGGALQAVTLLRSYQKTSGHIFPLHSTILDSCPGRSSFHVAFRVLALPLSGRPLNIRLPLVTLLYLLFGLWWIIMVVLRMENSVVTLWRELNNKDLVKEQRRVYIYSDVDRIIPWQDVEDHAVEARRKGLNIQLEKFVGSAHVAHARVGDGERYWRIVNEVWKSSVNLAR